MGQDTNRTELLIGALVGGVAVGASAFFLSSKRGRHLRRSVVGKLQEYSNQAGEAIEVVVDKAREAEEWRKKTTKRAKKALNNALENLDDHGRPYLDLKIGLIVGGVLGGALAFGANRYFRDEQPHSYRLLHDVDGYLNGAREVVDRLSGLFADRASKTRSKTSNTLRDFIELASAGLSLVQNFRGQAEED